MDIRKLQRVIVNALEDVKAQDIKIFNTSKQTVYLSASLLQPPTLIVRLAL